MPGVLHNVTHPFLSSAAYRPNPYTGTPVYTHTHTAPPFIVCCLINKSVSLICWRSYKLIHFSDTSSKNLFISHTRLSLRQIKGWITRKCCTPSLRSCWMDGFDKLSFRRREHCYH